MGYGVKLIEAATDEPVTVPEAKAQCQLAESINYHNDALEGYIRTARNLGESLIGRTFLQSTWELILDRFPSGRGYLYLPRPPLLDVEFIKYLDTSGVERTWDEDQYIVSTSREPGRVSLAAGASWPTTINQADAVTIRFVAGYATPADVPDAIRQAMLLAVCQWFNNRGDDARQDTDLPKAAKSLLLSQWPGDEFTCYGPEA